MSIDPAAPFALEPQRGIIERLAELARRLASLERRWGYEPSVFPGMLVTSATATAPPGYLVCDGSAVSRTTYAELFAAIGTAYGAGDSSTTFNLPNMNSGRFPRGNASPGGSGGNTTATSGGGSLSGTTLWSGPIGGGGGAVQFATYPQAHTHDTTVTPPYENVVWFVKT